jgi:hypothetical protein
MIRPAAFDYNPETAGSNSMQKQPTHVAGSSSNQRARDELDCLVRALQSERITVCDVEDTPVPPKPDAVFPNNWVSFHADGTVVLYPMCAENRRPERRRDALQAVAERTGFAMRRILDLTHHELSGRFLEGTGSLVLDHAHRVAYASLSPRTDADVVEEWADAMSFEPVIFAARDRAGVPVYHTNVLLCIGERFAVAGTDVIAEEDRARVLERLAASGRELFEIGHDEVGCFAGNMLELASWDEALGDCRVLVMSASARHALHPEALARLSACTDTVLSVPIPTIERLGGGSVRCTMAEVFLPS